MNTSQSGTLTPLLAEAACMLARINPAAFATRPRSEALAAVRAALAQLPRSSTLMERQRLARKAATGRKSAEKLEAAPYYYPDLFAEALAAYGIAGRDAVVPLLQEYHRKAFDRNRLEERRVATAVKKAELKGLCIVTAAASARAGSAQSTSTAAKQAAKPKPTASAEENAAAAAGYARLKAAGAFD